MFVAWGILAIVGVLCMRMSKQDKERAQLFFRFHWVIQSVVVLLCIIGFGLGVKITKTTHFSLSHHIIGLTITLIAILQPLNGFFRPHKPKVRVNFADDIRLTRVQEGEPVLMRRLWEWLHRFVGVTLLVLVLTNFQLGALLRTALISTTARLIFIAIPLGIYVVFAYLPRPQYTAAPGKPITASATLTAPASPVAPGSKPSGSYPPAVPYSSKALPHVPPPAYPPQTYPVYPSHNNDSAL
jgi:hypothetical protein